VVGNAVSVVSSQREVMPHAIIRGKNGRRHEVDFGDTPVHVEISRPSRRDVGVSPFSTFLVTGLAKPPAPQRDVPESDRTSSSLTFPAAVTVCFSTSEHINFEKYPIAGKVIV
jgi:hypothetical protein